MLASLWAKAPGLPAQPLAYVQEAPGILASLWRSTPSPSLQNMTHVVRGNIQNILQSMVPGSSASSSDASTGVMEDDKVKSDTASLDSPVKSVVKGDTPIKTVKK